MPPVMRPYVVQQGDYLTKLAHVYGFDAAEVWNHPANEAIRGLRPNPEILLPGDVLHIPVRPKDGLPLDTGTTNRFRARVPRVKVALVFRHDDHLLSDEPYEVQGLSSEGVESKGQTDGEGRVELDLPVTVREVSILFPRLHVAYDVRVGDMDPEEEASGIRKRLENLGFLRPSPHSTQDEEELLRVAIIAFQRKAGLTPTGALDDTTKKALLGAHGL